MATTWVLTKGMTNLRNQINVRWPNRDHESDGTIGDLAHQMESSSSHNPDETGNAEWEDSDNLNEVRAFDCDNNFNEEGMSGQKLVDHFRKLPGFSSVCRYMIYWDKIYKAANNWAAQDYSGLSAHHEHIHFTGQFTQESDNNSTFDFKLEEVGIVELSDDTIEKLSKAFAKELLNADMIPYTNAAGVSDTWALKTAIGYMTGKSRELPAITANTDAIAKNTPVLETGTPAAKS